MSNFCATTIQGMLPPPSLNKRSHISSGKKEKTMHWYPASAGQWAGWSNGDFLITVKGSIIRLDSMKFLYFTGVTTPRQAIAALGGGWWHEKATSSNVYVTPNEVYAPEKPSEPSTAPVCW